MAITKVSKPVDNNIYYCIAQVSDKCRNKKGVLTIKDFYMASNLNLFKNGKVSICKECMKEYVYIDKQINIDRFKKILMLCDLPFFSREFESALSDSKETIGVYMKNIYLNYKDKTWNDGEIDKKTEIKTDEDSDFTVTKEMKKRWGRNYSTDDYEFLEDTYYEWCNKYKSDTLSEQKTFQFLTLKELEIRKAREQGSSTDKLEETYRRFSSDANVIPRDANAMNDSENLNTLGIWTRDIEKYRPAEYFEDKKVYNDNDNMKSYYERFILRPLKNLLIGTREFDREFNVENESDIENEDGDNNG